MLLSSTTAIEHGHGEAESRGIIRLSRKDALDEQYKVRTAKTLHLCLFWKMEKRSDECRRTFRDRQEPASKFAQPQPHCAGMAWSFQSILRSLDLTSSRGRSAEPAGGEATCSIAFFSFKTCSSVPVHALLQSRKPSVSQKEGCWRLSPVEPRWSHCSFHRHTPD